eukprot:1498581-Pyramimonas_sp.AAC.1
MHQSYSIGSNQCQHCGECLACSVCTEYFYDDELGLMESDDDSDDDLDFEDEGQAQAAHLQYESSCAEWDNIVMPQEIEDKYQ